MQKILIVVNSSENIVNFRLPLIRKLIKNNILFISAPDNIYKKKILRTGCKYEKNLISRNSKNIFYELRTIIDLYKQIRKIKPNIVMTYTIKPNLYLGLINLFFKIRIISTVTGLGSSFLKKNILTKFLLLIYKISFRNSFVVFQNNYDRNLFIEKQIVSKKQSQVIKGSGIKIYKLNLKKNKNKKTSFLFCSRLIKDKGFIEFVEASRKILMEDNKNIKIYIVNNFDKKNISQIENMNDLKLHKNIVLLKRTNSLNKYFKKVDCVILPSYREGLPKTLAEAASFKKILIASDVPGCNSVVKNNYNGFLCKVKNVESLYYCMKKVIKLNYNDRITFQNNSRKISLEFDEIKVNKLYEKIIYKSLQ